MSATASESDVPIANPPGLQSEKLVGDANKPGMFILRQHLPAGGLMRPHFHSADRHIVILSGELRVCNSPSVSTATTKTYKAGDFFTEPANSVHCSWAKDGAADYLEIADGPITTTSVAK